ncbi:hypothetical protein GGR04_003738 [Aureimonas pseudogalii]|uniref:Uncharacterized protein n=1 Tax=Aureimonas pseudogalii TaxID=1744844 RepID=A0A7W6MLJ7_9HYPH|nr:hypothetical protein [Aureimonas pseudogalii]
MTHNGGDHVDAIVDWAEEASKRICDRCGRDGRMDLPRESGERFRYYAACLSN